MVKFITGGGDVFSLKGGMFKMQNRAGKKGVLMFIVPVIFVMALLKEAVKAA